MNAAYLIILFPLVGFGLLLAFGKRLGEPKAGWLATTAVAGSFVAAIITFAALLNKAPSQRAATKNIFTWIPVAGFHVKAAILVDPLSITMALFVTGVGALIHLYSIGYMHGDERYHQFFLYLNLFAFSMLCLVLADSFLFMFLGWEGVGACSYFLVSFWFERPRAARAGKKAFITNRVGDWGFMIAMFLIFGVTGSLTYTKVFAAAGAGSFSHYTAAAVCLLLFLGACGKSAQLPLFIWLPDAMEGPTPVSALIHAATMVTAGVYLMCRVSPLLGVASKDVGTVIAVVGAVTALFAATIACAQDDIKRVLAYSTISQLGYMLLAVGCGAYVAAVFHMIMHAFFKALLFLGAGAVIHGLHDEQDMKRMGGLYKWMPITAITFIVGWLAIAGIPPFAGFWSKDAILSAAYHKSVVLYAVGAFTAGLTAYYMSRQVALTFFGKERWRAPVAEPAPTGAAAGGEPDPVPGAALAEAHDPPHRAPWTMAGPLVVLAVLSTVGWLINAPWGKLNLLDRWLASDPLLVLPDIHVATSTKWILGTVTLALSVAGIAIGYRLWATSSSHDELEPEVLRQGWWYDAAVSAFMNGPGRAVATFSALFDNRVIDGAVNGVAAGVRYGGSQLRRLQTGYVRNYALGIAAGAAVLLGYVVVRAG
jgi:NADH-quinone oxidoreductase subunit L